MLPEGWRLSKLLLILLVTINIGALAAFLLYSYVIKSPIKESVKTSPAPAKSVSSVKSPTLPIDPHSPTVKSAGILYLLAGVVDSVKITGQGDQATYEVQIFAPTGILLDKKFTITKQSATVVSLDKKGIEGKFVLSELKKGDQVLINYYIDLQENDDGQVTKIAITK